jgi:hypothetical protein
MRHWQYLHEKDAAIQKILQYQGREREQTKLLLVGAAVSPSRKAWVCWLNKVMATRRPRLWSSAASTWPFSIVTPATMI